MGELPVIREAADAEVDRFVVRLVGVACSDEFLDHGDHARDVCGFRRGGETVGRLDAEGFEVLEERVFERFGEIGEGNAFLAGAADGFVVDVGQIHDALDLEAAVFEVALQEIFEKISAEVADVGVVVDCRAARVDLDPLAGGIERHEGLQRARQGVVEPEQKS